MLYDNQNHSRLCLTENEKVLWDHRKALWKSTYQMLLQEALPGDVLRIFKVPLLQISLMARFY